MRVFLAIPAGLAFLTLGNALLQAQSLGDLAREEEARRKKIKTVSKVYTNQDLRDTPSPPAPAPAPAPAPLAPPAPAAAGTPSTTASSPAASTPAAPAPDGVKPTATSAEAASKRDESYWRERMRLARTTLDRNETYIAALQSRVNALTTDFVNRDDPAQRAVIAAERKRALGELERLKTQIELDHKAIADLQEEARRASVPPGWLR
jgi:hypothetical protein